jgi:hypothetical protein
LEDAEGVAAAGPARDNREQLDSLAVVELLVLPPTAAVRDGATGRARVGGPIALEHDALLGIQRS